MKIFKRVIAALIICLIVTMTLPVEFTNVTLTVEAHSGRTDRFGGHKDNKNKSGIGDYHYHCGGYPAHLHKDGVCPYAGINNATQSSSPADTNNASTTNNTTANDATVNNDANTSSMSKISDVGNNAPTMITISDASYDNAAFNASYYANRHKDVYDIYGDDAKSLFDHYISSGMAEGRQSSAQFNIAVYKANNQDLADAFGDDLIKYYNHFIEYGVNENRISK